MYIDNLWELFSCALDLADNWTSDNEARFIECFDTALKQFGVRWNITMALYWIRPYDFINLDDRNRQYLALGEAFPPVDAEIASKLKNVPSGAEYLEIIKELKRATEQSGASVNINSFIDLSHHAWLATTGEKPALTETITDVPLNTVLYGPPGTGKTYYTAIYAVAIVEGKELAVVEAEAKENYSDVFARYNEHKARGRIEFTTFHQSYGYEEFIEGIKPVVDEADGISGIEYSVEDGVFKAFCGHAQLPQSCDINPDAKIWKVVLGNGNLVTSNPTKFDCFNGNKVVFNWNAQEDHVGTYNYNQITHFRERINIGDVVVSYAGNGTDIDSIGIVTGDAVYDEKLHSYKWSRSVRWLNWIHPQHPINIKALNGNKYFDNDMLQQLKRVSLSDLIKLLRPRGITTSRQNHVFIIDEINRGNISKVFGELITLIEPSKRIGAAEELTTVLPYSQQPFGVPNNVYIIGTMNTADRSIAAIDTALRRRFQFREMMPNADVLAGIAVDGISVSDMLTRMNKRIEVLYDREHTIGHAYFMPLKDSPTIETLAGIFADRIIPLLQEYFYEDYEKIRLVLGDNRKNDESEMFITKKQNSYAELFGTMDLDMDEGFTYEINKAAFGNIEAYKTI